MKNMQLRDIDLRVSICLYGLLLFAFGSCAWWCSPDEKENLNLYVNKSEPSRREIIGGRIYMRYCAGCHGETGEGDGLHSYLLNPPPANLADSALISSLSDEELIEVINRGGAFVGKSAEMPRWKDILKKHDTENLILFLRTLSRKKGGDLPS